jgi:hypothetical protein
MYDFSINGTVDTGQSCMSNLTKLFTACGAWITYDVSAGKWSFTIKQAGPTVFAFNDTNIIGGISVSSTGITDLYNKCTVTYPHKDLSDKTDQIDVEIPVADRYADEIDNTLLIDTNLINDPIQAQFIATVELKQSRLDTLIKFTTDYTAIGLKAGDIITVTNSLYGYSFKKFRITSIQEDDTDVIGISITALEYDSAVYNTSGLIYTKRDEKTGIIPKSANTVLAALDNKAITTSVSNGLAADSTLTNAIGGALVQNGGAMMIASSGSYTASNLPPCSSITDNKLMMYVSFIAPHTATYVCSSIIDQNSSLAYGGRGEYIAKINGQNAVITENSDFISVYMQIVKASDNTVLVNEGSGGIGAYGWTDFALSATCNLVENTEYTILFLYNEYCPENLAIFNAQGANPNIASFTVNWNVFTAVNPDDFNKQSAVFAANTAGLVWVPGQNGLLLDARAKIILPNASQTIPVGKRGTGQISRFPATGNAFLTWGGDTTGSTSEVVLVNFDAIKAAYPNETKIVIELKGVWGTTGTSPFYSPGNPVKIDAYLWKGGTPVQSGTSFSNPTATETKTMSSAAVTVTANYYTAGNSDIEGDVIAYLTYNTIDGNIAFTTTMPT